MPAIVICIDAHKMTKNSYFFAIKAIYMAIFEKMYHNYHMGESKDTFEEQLLKALDDRKKWFDTNILPKVQEDYRLHHSCVNNIIGVLEKKALITPDPYKHDKKISDIVSPEGTDFSENERQIVLGTRLSDYESMIDFICNYFKFSVEHVTFESIRKLNDLNNTFQWNSLSLNSTKPNTRALATVLASARNGADPLTLSLLNDSASKSAKAIQEITSNLRALAEFQRELYKGDIRKLILKNPQCNRQKAMQSPTEMQIEIKRLFPAVMGKRTYYNDLIDEIILEDIGLDKERRRQNLLSSMNVVAAVKEKKEASVDTHEILMDAIRVLGTMSEQYDAVNKKIHDNHDVIEGEQNTLASRILKNIRKLFGIPEPPVDYELIITDRGSETQRRERIHYNQFVSELEKRARQYASFAVRKTPGYNRIAVLKDNEVLDYLNKELASANELLTILGALDEFFKDAVTAADRPRIKGIKMELTTLKNTMVKANQRRAEYSAYIEEQIQMKKLGIIDK